MINLLRKINARIPKKMPIGMLEFHYFCDELFDLYNIPDKKSYRQAIANILIHRVPGHKVKMHDIACAVRKAQTDEVCYAYVDELIKEKKQAAKQTPLDVQ